MLAALDRNCPFLGGSCAGELKDICPFGRVNQLDFVASFELDRDILVKIERLFEGLSFYIEVAKCSRVVKLQDSLCIEKDLRSLLDYVLSDDVSKGQVSSFGWRLWG